MCLGLELGKYAVWSELTHDKHKEVLDTICNMWDALVGEKNNVMNDNFSNSVQWERRKRYQVNQRYEPKATTNAPKKGATNVGNASKSSSMLKSSVTSTKKGNITMSNSYSALNDESDEDVENVYNESDNLFQSTRIIGSSSTFTAGVG
ncbi:hypothetical protein Tco_0184772 [Tanacetum coccineum]